MKTLLFALVLASQTAHAECVVMLQGEHNDDVSEWHFPKEQDAINFVKLARKGQPDLAALVECATGDMKKDKPKHG